MISRSTDIKAALRSRQRGFLLNPFRFGGAAPGGDPYWSNVSFLLGSGPIGSGTFSDLSNYNHAITNSGSVVVANNPDASKYAIGPVADLRSSSILNTPTSTAFSISGDYTIEAFILGVADGGYRTVFIMGDGSNRVELRFGDAGVSNVLQANIGSGGTGNLMSGTWNLFNAADKMLHVAITRQSGVNRLFVEGQQAGSSNTNSFTIVNGSVILGGIVNQNWNGYIGQVRVTKGIARYTENFDPPTAPFPNFGP